MKNPMYDYVFKHRITKARLSFESRSIEEATIILARMVNNVADWDMKRYRHK
jgi:hypothetical protein